MYAAKELTELLSGFGEVGCKGENLMVPMRAAKKLTEFLDLPQDRLSHTVMEQFAHGSAK